MTHFIHSPDEAPSTVWRLEALAATGDLTGTSAEGLLRHFDAKTDRIVLLHGWTRTQAEERAAEIDTDRATPCDGCGVGKWEHDLQWTQDEVPLCRECAAGDPPPCYHLIGSFNEPEGVWTCSTCSARFALIPWQAA